jgi:hypothetical protein
MTTQESAIALTQQQPASAPGSRLDAVRRLYLYFISFVTYVALLVGISLTLDALASVWLGNPGMTSADPVGFARTTLVSGISALAVAGPLFLVHWLPAQHFARTRHEAGSGLRKLFLYAASAVTTGWFVVSAGMLVSDIAKAAFGLPLDSLSLWPDEWLTTLGIFLISGLLLALLFDVIVHDGDYGVEKSAPRLVRQLVWTFAGLLGLWGLIWGVSGLIWVGLDLLVSAETVLVGRSWQHGVADNLSVALVGGWLLNVVWQQWQEVIARQPLEAGTAVRRLFLYAAIVMTTLGVLIPLGETLRLLLIALFDLSSFNGWLFLVDSLPRLSWLVTSGVALWLLQRYLAQEIERAGATPAARTVRRIYVYTVAATALAVLWYGLVQTLFSLFDLWLGSAADSVWLWTDPLATGLAMVAVSLPVWVSFWRDAQTSAARDDGLGVEERSSWPRKIYLFGVALVGAVFLLVFLASTVYRLLMALFGDANALMLSAETANSFASALVAAILWSFHLLALRSDNNREKKAQAAGIVAGDASAQGERRVMLTERIGKLEEELAHLRKELERLG